MARPALVLDASVGVKWFSSKDEASLGHALAIRDAHISEQNMILVPDLFYYEVVNAVIHKPFFSTEMVQAIVLALYSLNLKTVSVDAFLLKDAALLARQSNITIYDSCYVALARSSNCPLVTANPRHQRQDLGCPVIPIEQWKI